MSVLEVLIAQAQKLQFQLDKTFNREIIPVATVVLNNTRSRQLEIMDFLKSHVAYMKWAELRKLEKNAKFDDISLDQFELKVPEVASDACVKNLMERGLSSRHDLVSQLKSYFEGPVNLELLLFGTIKKSIQAETKE